MWSSCLPGDCPRPQMISDQMSQPMKRVTTSRRTSRAQAPRRRPARIWTPAGSVTPIGLGAATGSGHITPGSGGAASAATAVPQLAQNAAPLARLAPQLEQKFTAPP